MEAIYTAKATVQGGREGKVSSSDGAIQLDLSMPKELQGPGGSGTNPEQLFAAGYAACYESALKLVARNKKMAIGDTQVTAQVSIGNDPAGGFKLAVQLDVKIPGVEVDVAKELIQEAHHVCPYSKATRGNIDVVLRVVK
ncbi:MULTISPECIES: organic hydroperoxide resistance protein [Bacillaceae]|uniref:organic hydroperoxide resistance protein n=1 Tax=Bacillaceae TaxID=186817 RepID=UPI001BDF5205|nr:MULTISPECIES: organic hydroperoxide resistance protein [Bacillaceae]MDX8360992.1 organic hydroperoxide resistance protein [Cytobacillus sp. IB215316]MDX8363615.1 organic hydroperoxide resistance protein [Cytobacillus sp. IB215665]